jgi:hypothetical protein
LHVPPITREGRRPEGTSFDSKLFSPPPWAEEKVKAQKTVYCYLQTKDITFFSNSQAPTSGSQMIFNILRSELNSMKFKPNLSKPPNDVTADLPGEYAPFSQVVEFQIPPASKLRDENNLPYVSREVLDDVENCFEARYLKALDDSFLKETTCIEVLEDYVSLAECFFKPVKKHLFRERAACKLSRSVSDVILSSDAGDNPLTDIAAEMENKIADAVVCLVRSPPNVLFAQRFKAPANLRKIIFRQLATRDLNERLTIS